MLQKAAIRSTWRFGSGWRYKIHIFRDLRYTETPEMSQEFLVRPAASVSKVSVVVPPCRDLLVLLEAPHAAEPEKLSEKRHLLFDV